MGSIQPQPIEFSADGSLDLDRVAAKIKADDAHFARTKLLALENTVGGKVLSLEYCKDARSFVDEHGLSLHLDGARIWNAASALGVDVNEVAAPFDSVSVCLSKGLGAPVGSVLTGTAELIARAHRWRKMLGGGMRQAGIIAAAGIHALDHNRERVADDHALATALGDALAQIPGVTVSGVETNMVFAQFAEPEAVAAKFDEAGILAAIQDGTSRFVTHLDLPADTAERVAQTLA